MVKFTAISAVAALLAVVSGVPVEKRQAAAPAITDADILQFALTLEHLENTFYVDGLMAMPESEFVAAGYSTEYYNNLKYIAHDEEQHVELLTSALSAAGAKPVAACTYKFPYTDAKSFVSLASVLEGVGAAAYLGAAPAITDKSYLSVAGSILVTEAIHNAIQRYALGEVAPANAYGSSLIPDAAYTLAAAFITGCPSSNVALPFMAFPTLTATQGIPAAPGITFTFDKPAAAMTSSMYITFVNGLETISMPATMIAGNMLQATIPTTVSGQTYAILTNANTTMLTNSQVIAGPAILEVTPPSPDFAIAP